MKDIKVKTIGGKAVHLGFSQDGDMGTYCLTGRNSTLVEVPANTEVTCKHCLKGHVKLTPYSHHPAQETTPTEVPVEVPTIVETETIRISADMEAALNRDLRILNSLQTACQRGVSWGAGKLLVTRAGRDMFLWYLQTRAEIAQEALTDGRPVYPARRAQWHAVVKLNRQASYMLAA